MISARDIFGPLRATRDGTVSPRVTPVGWRLIRGFYQDRFAWAALIVTGLFTAYAGGAVMFWVHAIRLGEGGPDIPPLAHWALDSTAGFVGLTPALALVLPLAVQFSGARSKSWSAVRGLYVLTAGAVFAVLTMPGPIMHDMLVARGTWIAKQITLTLGPGGGPTTPPNDVPTAVSIAYQFGVGLPTYIVCVGLALVTVRFAAAALRKLNAAPKATP